MRKRDYFYLLAFIVIGWWALPHLKEDAVRAVVPDRIERLFPRLVDRIVRPKREVATPEPAACQSQVEVNRLFNADPPPVASADVQIDHGYGW